MLVNVNFMAGNVTNGQFYFNGAKMELEKSPYPNVVQVEINKRDRHLNLNCLP